MPRLFLRELNWNRFGPIPRGAILHDRGRVRREPYPRPGGIASLLWRFGHDGHHAVM